MRFSRYIFLALSIFSIIQAQTTQIAHIFAQATKQYMQGNYRDAASLYKEIMHIHTAARYNYGLCCHTIGLFSDAHEAFMHVSIQDPTHTNVRSKIRLHALRTKDWDLAYQYGVEPYWWYNADVNNKTVLCTSNNAGIGDIVQFLRYLKHLHNAGAFIMLEAPHYLHTMLSQCHFINKLLSPNSNQHADIIIRVSTPELTLTMHDTLNAPSCDIPYLYADKQRCMHWQSIFSHDKHFKIGLCWRSSMMTDARTGTLIPSPRSIPLSCFAPLFNHKGCSFYSLQVGHGTEELMQHTFPITTFDNTFDRKTGAFTDTLAVMQQLDLIITVDTSVAHIAGALGVPVWVLLPACSDFRWFLDTEASPWYPTMKLFRQKNYGEWNTILQEVYTHLSKLIE